MGMTEKNGIDREKWENKIDSETRARRFRLETFELLSSSKTSKELLEVRITWTEKLSNYKSFDIFSSVITAFADKDMKSNCHFDEPLQNDQNLNGSEQTGVFI